MSALPAPAPAPARPRAAVVILTQNTDVRKAYLKTTLYFLFKHWNARHRYPVLIFHEGDYDAMSQREILLGVRMECRDLVSFVALDREDFTIPPHIDQDRMRRCLALKPVPYWRNDKYRLMCRWWIVELSKYTAGYDYVMRLDDDSIIEEPVSRDLFAYMAERDLVYAGNIIHTDCGICCHGMREFFSDQIAKTAAADGDAAGAARREALLATLFTSQDIPPKAVMFHPFRQILSILGEDGRSGVGVPDLTKDIKIQSPRMFFNNFFITQTAFWRRPEIQRIIRAFDLDGRWAYLRWGDSPVQSLIVSLFAKPEEVATVKFAYSKRLTREAFVGETVTGAKEIYAYTPAFYCQTSCVTDPPPPPEVVAAARDIAPAPAQTAGTGTSA
jgi:hypothetical protein